jgi:hypothetical protein
MRGRREGRPVLELLEPIAPPKASPRFQDGRNRPG